MDQTISFINTIFQSIIKAQNIEDLKAIEIEYFEDKYRMDTVSYPKVEFSLSPEEIEQLVKDGILNSDYSFNSDTGKKLQTPLEKLLYALAWKNGDLKKLKHITKGIAEINDKSNKQEEALVFYQFGRFLTKTKGEPIIDQHVIRAFATYILDKEEDVAPYLKLNSLTKKNQPVIDKYKDWLQSDMISDSLKQQEDYTYYIDRILFAAGRKIKVSKENGERSKEKGA